jgi:hypothetical protein
MHACMHAQRARCAVASCGSWVRRPVWRLPLLQGSLAVGERLAGLAASRALLQGLCCRGAASRALPQGSASRALGRF